MSTKEKGIIIAGVIKVGIYLLAPYLVVVIARQLELHVSYMQALTIQLWITIVARL